MKRYQQYVRYSGLRPHDFEGVSGLPTKLQVAGWCITAAAFGYLGSYFL